MVKANDASAPGLKKPTLSWGASQCSPTCQPPAPRPSRDPASPDMGEELSLDLKKRDPSPPARGGAPENKLKLGGRHKGLGDREA